MSDKGFVLQPFLGELVRVATPSAEIIEISMKSLRSGDKRRLTLSGPAVQKRTERQLKLQRKSRDF